MRRLRSVGSDDAQRLLSGEDAAPPVPVEAEERVWRAIEARRFRSDKRARRAPRWVILSGLLLTGTGLAAAATQTPSVARWAAALVNDVQGRAPAPPVRRAAAPRRTTEIVTARGPAAATDAVVSEPVPPPSTRKGPAAPRAPGPRPLQPLAPSRVATAHAVAPTPPTETASGPAREPAEPITAPSREAAEPETPPIKNAPPPRRHVVISQDGEAPLAFRISENEVRGGTYRGGVALSFDGRMITGKFAGEVVWIRLDDDRAEGSIGDYQVRLRLAQTRGGARLSGSVGGVRVRLQFDGKRLGWAPGCDRWLLVGEPLTDGSSGYQGRCADERAVRLHLPPAFQTLPPLRKLLVFAFLLPAYHKDLRASIDVSGMVSSPTE